MDFLGYRLIRVKGHLNVYLTPRVVERGRAGAAAHAPHLSRSKMLSAPDLLDLTELRSEGSRRPGDRAQGLIAGRTLSLAKSHPRLGSTEIHQSTRWCETPSWV